LLGPDNPIVREDERAFDSFFEFLHVCDRIIVGEARGGEALDMLQAMNTGHDGSMTTAHSNSPRDTLSRLETMTMMAGMDRTFDAVFFTGYHARAGSSFANLDHTWDGPRVVQGIWLNDTEVGECGLNAALAGTDPVVFFESQKIYDFGEMFVESGVPEGYYEIPLSEPSIKRAGKDLTIGILGNPDLPSFTVLPIVEEDYSVLPPDLPKIINIVTKYCHHLNLQDKFLQNLEFQNLT
jgi:hypothetical protein